MSGEFVPFSAKELRRMNTVDGVARILWRRYHRAMRLWWRAETARIDHEIMYGTGGPEPRGIIHCGGGKLGT